jgi:hypothetical protein
MKLINRMTIVLVFIILCSSLAGCGGESHKFVPAKGIVKIKGKPAAEVMVRFLPDSIKGNKGPASYATTDASGNFELKSDNGQVGAVVGPHRVMLEDLKVDRPAQGKPQLNPPRFAAKWSVGTTGPEVEVKETGEAIEIDVN